MIFIPNKYQIPGGSTILITPIPCRAKNCDGTLTLKRGFGPYGYAFYSCYTCKQSFDYEYIKHDEELRQKMNTALE